MSKMWGYRGPGVLFKFKGGETHRVGHNITTPQKFSEHPSTSQELVIGKEEKRSDGAQFTGCGGGEGWVVDLVRGRRGLGVCGGRGHNCTAAAQDGSLNAKKTGHSERQDIVKTTLSSLGQVRRSDSSLHSGLKSFRLSCSIDGSQEFPYFFGILESMCVRFLRPKIVAVKVFTRVTMVTPAPYQDQVNLVHSDTLANPQLALHPHSMRSIAIGMPPPENISLATHKSPTR